MTKRKNISIRSEAGFTLIELIVSMTLMALLAIGIAFAIRFGMRAWERSDANVKLTDEAMRVESLLRTELSSAYPGYTDDGPADRRLEFLGYPDRLEFLAPAPQALLPAGRVRVIIKGMSGPHGFDLVWAATPELNASRNTVPSSEILLAGLQTLELSYFGSIGDEPAGWRNQWVSAARLPILVRIRADIQDGRALPEIIVAPRITSAVGCRLDPLTHSCRGG